MTTFYIVRHGESEANELGVIAGHSDYHLTELGKMQAEETAAHLSDVVLDAVYASDLARAMETAAPHAVPRGLTVIPSVQMRETFCGDWEGVSFAEVKAKDPEGYAAFTANFITATLPNGENVLESGKRFYRELVRVASLHEGKNVLVVAHGAVIRALWALISHTPLDEATEKHPYASNSSYSIAYCEGGTLTPGVYSEDAHLSFATHLHI